MAKRSDITPELCRQLLHYEPSTGRLFWKYRTIDLFATPRAYSVWNAKHAGKEAFLQRNQEGYLRGVLMWQTFRAARVAWAIYHGRWPDGEIDHKNGRRDDNRIENLRDVPRSVNARNRTVRSDNRSGYPGVKLDLNSLRWRAHIRTDQGNRSLGSFYSLEEAIAARQKAEQEHGYGQAHVMC
jgi:hypothetical protein